jgi:hypothetical protein
VFNCIRPKWVSMWSNVEFPMLNHDASRYDICYVILVYIYIYIIYIQDVRARDIQKYMLMF